MTYGITSESDLIDLSVINSGCDAINAAAQNFVACGNKVIEAGTICNSSVLSMDNVSLESTINGLGENIKTFQTNIEGYTAEIKSRASRIYNEQYNELQEYRRRMAEKKESENA